jgi:hypothetical protein
MIYYLTINLCLITKTYYDEQKSKEFNEELHPSNYNLYKYEEVHLHRNRINEQITFAFQICSYS